MIVFWCHQSSDQPSVAVTWNAMLVFPVSV